MYDDNDGWVVSSDSVFWFDNASARCEPCYECSDQRLLRWTRILVLKVGRMYLGAPICLILFPLLVGIWIGKRGLVRKRTSTTRQNNADKRESGVDPSLVPKHIAVIMDGNRRYGKAKYGNSIQGHTDGSKTLVEFAKWCVVEGVGVLTVFCFSTENWNRDASEIEALMSLFVRHCHEIRIEAVKRNMRVHVLSTDTSRIPQHVQTELADLVHDTRHGTGLVLNLCVSYGSRGELVRVCQTLAKQQQQHDITEESIRNMLLTRHCPDPDVVLRTSGEYRLSNFLLWQSAYAELFFVSKKWPEIQKEDLLDLIRSYANNRNRRYGK